MCSLYRTHTDRVIVCGVDVASEGVGGGATFPVSFLT